MKIYNPLKMNDWPIGKFLILVVSLSLSYLGLITIDFMGLEIPILRQLVGFIYLTFIPGIAILRILKLHKLGNIKTLLYSVGLSIATIMLTTLFMNVFYPLIGISMPISLIPLTVTTSIIIVALCILAYRIDKDFFDLDTIDIREIFSPPTLFLSLFPVLAIFGAYIMNFYHNNIVQLLLLFLIALTMILIGFNKYFPRKLYPLTLLAVSIALLYHRSLISGYLTGSDIHLEYYLASLVKTNSKWIVTTPYTPAAMLSITLLPSTYSYMLDISIIWVFKIIYPLLFSLISIGMYHILQKQLGGRIAFFSCFLFISIFPFYTEMISLARQEIGEFFLILLVMLLVDKKLSKTKKGFLYVIFGFSLIVSHYSLSYIYMFYIFVLGITFLIVNISPRKFKGNTKKIINLYPMLILFFIGTAMYLWYTLVAKGEPFLVIKRIWNKIMTNISNILNPELSGGAHIVLQGTPSILVTVEKYLNLAIGFLIMFGMLMLFFRKTKYKLTREYMVISIANIIIILLCILLPYFSAELNTTRFLQITLIFLAPIFTIGWMTIFENLRQIFIKIRPSRINIKPIRVLSIFLAVYLLFNTSAIYIVLGEPPSGAHPPISLDSSLNYPYFNTQEILVAKWLKMEGEKNITIYADAYQYILLNGYFSQTQNHPIRGEIRANRIRLKKVPEGFIFWGTKNILEENLTILIRQMPFDLRTPVSISEIGFNNVLEDSNLLYCNGGGQLYFR